MNWKTLMTLGCLSFAFAASAAVSGLKIEPNGAPAFNGEVSEKTSVAKVTFVSSTGGRETVKLNLKGTNPVDIKALGLALATGDKNELVQLTKAKLSKDKAEIVLDGVQKGANEYALVITAGSDKKTDLRRKIVVEGKQFRIGSVVTAPGQEISDRNNRKSGFFRIPGIVETKKGNLVAIFDNRFNHGGDLPADITVGVAISTDKGVTWSKITTAMDFAEIPGKQPGIGDACILCDPANGRLWLAGLRSPDTGHPIWSSLSGSADIEKCGQIVLSYSDDEGKTWSKLINITPDVKRVGDADTAEWGLLFQGPGAGIAMADGTLVIPCQIWPGKDTGKRWRYGCLVYSKDHGKTWQSSKAMPWGGSEDTVVELEPGKLVLNVREGSARSRIQAYTTDMGETWTKMDISLNQPGNLCQAAFIKQGKTVYFSNPKSGGRDHMTIRTSTDGCKTWSDGLCYDPRACAGYSSLCTVDKDSIGVIYEGNSPAGTKYPGFHYFLRIPVSELK